jgi:hypothetical protein
MKMTGSGGRESYIGRAVKLNMTGDLRSILLIIEGILGKPLK